ncbi:MAG: FxLYD domain-containing protein [Planctomycetota bacterium]
MNAKLKCPNCGDAIPYFGAAWGWKQMLLMLPVMLVGFIPLMRIWFFKADAGNDLSISETRTRIQNGNLEIIGKISNSSSRTWSGVVVEAEFFDESGNFLDEASGSLRADIRGKAEDHFKITILRPDDAMSDPATEMTVKVAGGRTSRF